MTSKGHGRDMSTKQDLQSEHLCIFWGGKANCSIKNKTTWTHLQGVQYMLNYLNKFIERSTNC